MNTATLSPLQEQAAGYFALGWNLCTIAPGSKAPNYSDWNRRERAISSLDELPPGAQGIGLLHAYSGTCCLDIDDLGKAQAYLLERGINMKQLLSGGWLYQGRESRIKAVFTLEQPLVSVNRQDLGLELRCATAEGLSVQDVLPPTVHPETGKAYRWLSQPGGRPAPLPEALRAVWLDLLHQSKTKPAAAPVDALAAAATAIHDMPTVEQMRADLAVLDADCPYGQWRNVVWGVLATGRPEAVELAREWSMRAPHRFDEAAFMNVVNSYQPKPGGITYGTVRHLATIARLPQPQPLPDALHPVQPFDPALLPAKLRPWVCDIAERMGCPLDFVAIPVMVALGAVLGRKLAIRPQRRTDWAEVPNLWGLIVGRPGVLKSPALRQALAPVHRLAAEATERHAAALAAWRQAEAMRELRADVGRKKARQTLEKSLSADVSALLAESAESEPLCKRYTVTNATPEALGELLRQNPQGLLLERDEIMGFLRDLDREDHADHRAFMLETWAGNGAFTFDRIGRGFNLHIPAMCLSIIGTTQPGRLQAYVAGAVQGGAADDGLMQRFSLMVWPDMPRDWHEVDEWPDSQAKAQAWEVFKHLDTLTPEAVGATQDTAPDGQPDDLPYLRLDDDALARFQAWRTDLEQRLRSGDLPPVIENHLAKYRKLVPALALILHLAEGEVGSVKVQAVEQAIAWAGYLESHALRCYGAGIRSEVETARAILKRIKKGDLSREGFRSYEVWRPNWSGLSDRAQVTQALDYLAAMDWLTVETLPTGGREATIYKLNPKANL